MNDLMMTCAADATMTSVDIAEVTGKRHANVCRDLRALEDDGVIKLSRLGQTEKDSQNKELTVYHLPFNIVAMVISRYSSDAAMAIFSSMPAAVAKAVLRSVADMDLGDVAPDRFVYAAQDSAGRIKIGISKDPAERVQQLNIGHPDKLTLVYTRLASLPAYESETAAHVEADVYHLRSEWFSAGALETLQ